MAMVTMFVCVGCDKKSEDPGVGQQVDCECGLHTYIGGLYSFIWRDDNNAAPDAPARSKPKLEVVKS
jgi:hypothetical protein